MTASFKFNGILESLSDGEDYMIIKSAKINGVSMHKMKLRGTGLFPDPDLNSAVVEILNETWETLLQQIFPRFKSSWDPIIVQLINRFFERVPFRLLITD